MCCTLLPAVEVTLGAGDLSNFRVKVSKFEEFSKKF
jgi:hypothetical protein